MTHSRLIADYYNIFSTRQLDDLYDLLTDDFYFRNPKIEIFGKDEYIKYSKNNLSTYSIETVELRMNSETEYIREYYVTLLNSKIKYSDRLHIFETSSIKDGLIDKVILDYQTDHLSEITKKILDDLTKHHGTMLK